MCDAGTFFVLRAFPYVGKKEKEVGLGEHATWSLMEQYKIWDSMLPHTNFLYL